MEDLKLELDNLVRQLQRLQPAPDSTEAQTLRRLLDIRSLLEGGGHPAEKAAAFTALREFWLHRMAWCSALSRDVEKLIIIYADLSADADYGQRPDD